MAIARHFWALVPAAGESRRFRDAGYDTPKPLLRVGHKALLGGRAQAMIQHVFDSLPAEDLPCLAALPPGVQLPAADGATSPHHSMTVTKTRGQADTLRQMIRWIPRRHLEETALLIVNCDVVFRDPESVSWLLDRVRGGFSVSTLVVESQSDAMSYAYPYPCPQKFVEKQVVGKHAMAGAWAVASAARLLTALDWACCQGATEPYLSHALNRISGPKISRLIEPSEMIDLGTPKAVKTSGAVIFR